MDLIRDDAPILRWKNRLRLYEENFSQLRPDIAGVSEIDSLCGEKSECAYDFIQMMKKFGYAPICFDKNNSLSGSAIFYKKDRFNCLHSHKVVYE